MAQPDGAPGLSRSFSDPSSASRIGDGSRRQVALIWMRRRRVCGADRRGLYPSCDARSCPPSSLVAQRRTNGVDWDKRTNASWERQTLKMSRHEAYWLHQVLTPLLALFRHGVRRLRAKSLLGEAAWRATRETTRTTAHEV